MLTYNKAKTKILKQSDIDLEKGYLITDIITTVMPEVKESKEIGHYETIKEYKNGGKDVRWVVEIPGVPYKPEEKISEEIQVYIPYTKDELDKKKKQKQNNEILKRIKTLKNYLEETDYIIIKAYENILLNKSNDEMLIKYKGILLQRQQSREEINKLEEELRKIKL